MLNIPNMLSIFRLCLVPVYSVVYFSGLRHARLLAALIYAIATFTDFLDGYIARKHNLITNLGKVLDPLGDKMFTFAVLSCLAIDKIIPALIVIVFFIKEAVMGLGGLFIHRVGHAEIPPSNIFGKTATVCFFMVCVILMLFDNIPHETAVVLIWFALGISFMALISYMSSFFRIMKSSKERER